MHGWFNIAISSCLRRGVFVRHTNMSGRLDSCIAFGHYWFDVHGVEAASGSGSTQMFDDSSAKIERAIVV